MLWCVVAGRVESSRVLGGPLLYDFSLRYTPSYVPGFECKVNYGQR